MKKYIVLFFLSMHAIHAAHAIDAVPDLTSAQKIAHAIEDMQVDRLKVLFPQLSLVERSDLLRKRVSIARRVSFLAPPYYLLINRTPMERINANRAIGIDVWRSKLIAIEFLLRVYCEPTPTDLVYV